MKTEYTEKGDFLQRDSVEHEEYADDILLLTKSIRAAERPLETSTRYLEKKLKLKVNTEKSRAVSVYSIRNFGFSALRWEGTQKEHVSEFTKSRERKPKRN